MVEHLYQMCSIGTKPLDLILNLLNILLKFNII
ncbi:hypothetical protein DFR44_1206 [Hydromonas duriensis]|uniref:Uncharacterized protein n=1 Tax=Hydromonas duriensis TaxID=1527608 RepID=A0A4R6Y203_9BURK|nr:hypothetical protein DFR44_1206 [Hydromonas duriensis]